MTFLVKTLPSVARCVAMTAASGPRAAFLDALLSSQCQPRALRFRLRLEGMVFRTQDSLGSNLPPSPILQKSKPKLLPHQAEREDSTKFIVLTLVSIVAIVAVLLASGVIYCLRHSSRYRLKEKLSGPGGDTDPDATSAYQVKRDFSKCCFGSIHHWNGRIV